MRFTRRDLALLWRTIYAGLMALAIMPVIGFLGIGIIGVVIACAAVTAELHQAGVVNLASLYTGRMRADERPPIAEQIRRGLEFLKRHLALAKIVSAGLIVVGFGGHFLLRPG